MTTPKKLAFQLSIIALGLTALLLWSDSVLRNSRHAAMAELQNLKICREIAPQIESWRQKPFTAQSQAIEQPQLHQQIEKAATAAGFLPGSIDRISPEEPRRFGESAYKEVPVQVPVKGVTLRQLALFLHHLSTTDDSNLTVKSMRLTAPRGEETGDRWRAEITLTYLIYSPPTPIGQTNPRTR